MATRTLKREWSRVNADQTHYTVGSVVKISRSRDPVLRLRALLTMRKQLRSGRPRRYLSLARRMIGDKDNTCRWQALIVVGEFIKWNPEAVWRVVAKHAESPDEDMRVGIATVLLEHLLELDFRTYFPRVKRRVLSGRALFADTLGRCWVGEWKGRRWREMQALLRRAGAV